MRKTLHPSTRTDNGGRGQHATGRLATSTAPPSRKKRLLLLAPQPFFEGRGTPIAVLYVLKVMSRLDVQVDLVTFPVGEPVELPGLRTFRVGRALPIRHVPVGLSLRKVVLDVLLVLTALRLLRAGSYDWIHAVEEAAIPAAIARRIFKTPVLYDMASSLPEQLGKHRWLATSSAQRVLCAIERWLLRSVDKIVCSAGLKSYVQQTPGAAPVEEWIFPGRGADVPPDDVARLRQQLKIADSARVVVYTGTFTAYQGLDLLTAAAERVQAKMPDVIFVLVGASGGDAEALGPRPWLRLMPREPRQQIDRYLALAEIAVSPRRCGANLPLKVFDYMAAGKAIVATDCAAHRAVLDDSRARLVPATPDAFAEAIVELLGSRHSARRLAQAARAYTEAHCTFDAFVELVARVYDHWLSSEVAKGRHAPPTVRPGRLSSA